MRNLGLAEVARFLGVAQPARDVAFNGVSTDSRSITAGQLFVALSGERFDGHAFAGEAERRGAAALLGEHETCLLYTSPSPRDRTRSRMPSSA